MHEMSLIADLLRKIEAIAKENSAERIKSVKVRLGAMAHISADHFREHFVQGVKGSKAEGAGLEITESKDMTEPHAQEILLESVEVEGG